MKIDFSATAGKQIRKLNEPDKSRVLRAIYGLPAGDVKSLKEKENLRRFDDRWADTFTEEDERLHREAQTERARGEYVSMTFEDWYK